MILVEHYVRNEDLIETIEEPFIAHLQQPNRQPKRRALSALPLTISVQVSDIFVG